MENGSGLSRSNRASPRQVGRFLVAMNSRPDRRHFRHSLPLAGRQGTVGERMNGTAAEGRCRVKTGTLTASAPSRATAGRATAWWPSRS